MSTKALRAEITKLKEKENAIILAHYYQIDEVQEIADYTGDSFGLSKQAASTDAEVIVFSGVQFMAESAFILSPQKTVLLPELEAGCPLADEIVPGDLMARKKLPAKLLPACGFWKNMP
ncbi:MAG: quinolinate synthase NadA [Bacillota bacterium]